MQVRAFTSRLVDSNRRNRRDERLSERDVHARLYEEHATGNMRTPRRKLRPSAGARGPAFFRRVEA